MRKWDTVTISVLIFVLIVFAYQLGTKKTIAPAIQPVVSELSTIIPTTKPESGTQILQKTSGDGTVTLTIETNTSTTGINTNTFKVTKVQATPAQTIYEATSSSTIFYRIPDNTWSPDNKQFFVELITPDETKYLVYKADGTNYANGQKYLDIGDYWTKSKHTLKIRGVTGWASADLIIVYTAQDDNTPGPAFWFVTGSHNFLQLNS